MAQKRQQRRIMAFSTAEQRRRTRKAANELFGHPRGLTFLFATEMWERFSYYGMRALLVLYMVKLLLLPGHADNVIGLSALRNLFESVSGPIDVQPLSSHIYGLYTGLVYLTPVFGGMLADRVLGQRAAVPVRLDHAHSGQWSVQAQHVGAGGRPLCARRSAP